MRECSVASMASVSKASGGGEKKRGERGRGVDAADRDVHGLTPSMRIRKRREVWGREVEALT